MSRRSVRKYLLRSDEALKSLIMKRPTMLNLLSVLVMALAMAKNCALAIERPCTTPRRQYGSCVPLKNCPPLDKLILSTAKDSREYLSASIQPCYSADGTNNNQLICCEQNSITNVRETRAPNNYRSHPNYRLFDTSDCGLSFFKEIPDNKRKSTRPKVVPAAAGGLNAKPREFPWMALLVYSFRNRPGQVECGATIINERYVLTAAHCVVNLKEGQRLISVRVGEYNIARQRDCYDTPAGSQCLVSEDLSIEQVIAHQEYKDTYNDIALIRLGRKIKSHLGRPICLPFDTGDQIPGNLSVTGWGFLDSRNRQSTKLQKVDVPIFNLEECARVTKKQLTDKQICAGGQAYKGTCRGDSGGPLQSTLPYDDGYDRTVQFGVVSHGNEECGLEKSLPGIYTRLDKYLDWILDNVQSF